MCEAFTNLVTSSSDAESNLKSIKSLNQSRISQQRKLDQLRELGLSLPLGPELIAQLNSLESRWADSSSLISTRQQKLQDYCLKSLQLQARYQLWSSWLEEIRPLVKPLHPFSEEGLALRLCQHQLVDSEMASKTRILDSILTEGKPLIELESPNQTTIKVADVESQWESLREVLSDNKLQVYEALKLWSTFNSLRERLAQALSMLDSELQLVAKTKELHLTMCEKVPALKAAFEQHQQVALRLRQVGQRLIPDSDERSRQKIVGFMSSLHSHWQSVLSKLISQSEESTTTISTWRQLEGSFANFSHELKNIRQHLLTAIDQHHDHLQDQRLECDLLDMKLDDVNSKLAVVRFDMTKLQGHITDLSSLDTRLSIYITLIEDTKGLVSRRRMQITNALSVWSVFMTKVDHLLSEAQMLEKCYLNDSQWTIEELLDRISTHYESQLIRLESRIDLIVAEGDRLLPLSGDIYSSAIKHNCISLRSAINRLNKLADTRTAKLKETLTAILEFEAGMQALKSWLEKTEKQLSETSLADWRSETIAEQHSILNSLENNIDHHGRAVTAVVNLCSVLQHDQDASPNKRDREAVHKVRKQLKDKWKSLCNKVSLFQFFFSLHLFTR